MLRSLHVKNLAIIEDVLAEFDSGLNVITGETGAGKSIVVGALGLVLGERADKTMIRSGETQCSVEAAFEVADSPSVDNLLDELAVNPCEDGQLMIRRIVSSSGSGKNVVNDCPITLQTLKKIGNLLVDMHGPHDHQSLLSQSFQLDLLDSFGHLQKQRADFEQVYREMTDLEARRSALDCDDQEVAQQIDMLSFQIKEIEEADLTENDEEALKAEFSLVANAQQILELSQEACNALTDAEASAFNNVVTVQNALTQLSRILSDAKAWEEEAESISTQIQELAKSVNQYAHNIEADPERLRWLEDRMALLNRLKRKYGKSVKDIIDFLGPAKTRLHDLESRGENIAKLDAEIKRIQKRITSVGAGLSAERSTAAKRLAKAITTELHDLGFKHSVFEVSLNTAEPRASGLDEIDFGFAPNLGEDMRPLRAIASSGEISRVMLATKAVLADHDQIPVLVFDEIDTNVGGEMGNAIGDKLSHVAGKHQVLCITHLPQVAVRGTSHYVVVKEAREKRTHTSFGKIERDERVEEVARMLGGRDLTTVTLKHAREMLEKHRT